MKNLAISCFLTFIAFSLFSGLSLQSGNDVKNPGWLAGEWEGVGLQLNFPQTWVIEFSVKENSFLINYPSLECGGTWHLISSTRHQAVFREKIIKGEDKCVQGGKVVITRVDANHIAYSYFSPDSGKLEAHSTLINSKIINTKRS